MAKLWEKSSNESHSDIAKKVEAFTVGNDYLLDQVLVPYDLAASVVHAEALKDSGVLSDDEFRELAGALEEIHESWRHGDFEISIEDEDMHTAIERTLTDKLGELGKKIHAGRSRNDQVLTAVRLYEKEKLAEVLASVKAVASLLLNFAENHRSVPMPGFTHTRKAMLSTVALWAGSYAELLIMQHKASAGVLALIDRSPLGTAAGFGTTFSIDRPIEAKKLNFTRPMVTATTAQLSRGWVELQLVQYLCGITAVINRFCADVILYSSEAYEFFDLHKDVCTGSSIMPQKKNPDLAELIRARHSELAGHAATMQMLTTNLGSGYHRDLQLSKQPVIASFENVSDILEAASILIEAMQPNQQKLQDACTPELFAAERANKLVKEKGYSFREAYREVKENPQPETPQNPADQITEYTHLGSPGNPGIEVLREELAGIQ